MRIRDILRQKGDKVITIPGERTVHDAMHSLVVHRIGSLVVWGNPIAGIITERDILEFVTRRPQDIDRVRVSEVMTTDVITAAPDEKVQNVMDTMTDNRIRHLPIVDGRELVGLVSIGDVVNTIRKELENENQSLYKYIEGAKA